MFYPLTVTLFPVTYIIEVLAMYTETLSRRVPNLSSFVMFEKNTEHFIVSTAAMSPASIVDYAASPCSPALKLTGAYRVRRSTCSRRRRTE